MKYIVHKRFKSNSLCGEVNIPAMSEVHCTNRIIYMEGKPICFFQSENAHQYFAVNEDGMGMVRGKLTQAIQKVLSKRDNDYQARWDKVWADPVCQKYKRSDYDDYWLWNHEFFNAPIADLRYIADLAGVKGGI